MILLLHSFAIVSGGIATKVSAVDEDVPGQTSSKENDCAITIIFDNKILLISNKTKLFRGGCL